MGSGVAMFCEVFPVGALGANCILIGDGEEGGLAVIDPGGDAALISERIRASGRELEMILLTHGHLDHAGAVAELYGGLPVKVPLGLHPAESQLFENLAVQGQLFGMAAENPPPPDLWLEHGQRIALGRLTLEVRHTPGHSSGSVCFLVHGATEPLVIVGDLIIQGSVGRTDLFGGSMKLLEKSIRTQIYTLPDNTRIISGHGPASTIGHEKQNNFVVRAG